MSDKRILVWHWGRRGGGPRYTYELVRALIAEGDWEVHLSLSRQCEIFDEFEAFGIPSNHVDTYRSLAGAIIGSLRLPSIRRSFWNYVKTNGIDVVVCTMSHLWNVPVLMKRPKQSDYLMVLHDALPHPGDDVPLRHWLLKLEIDRSDGVVALTEHVRRILFNQYRYPRERTWVVPHGVFPYAQPKAASTGDGPVRLLFFGRIMPYKGLDLLLDAYAMLRRTRNDLELVIAGPGDLRPYADQLAGLAGITVDNRWIPEEEIGPIFQAADISVSPYREASQSGVISTAYAIGLPVLVTPIGGLVEQVVHERTGVICEAASAQAIADGIVRFLDDPNLRARCAEGALEAAEQTFAWPAIARRFGDAIGQLQAMAPLHHKP